MDALTKRIPAALLVLSILIAPAACTTIRGVGIKNLTGQTLHGRLHFLNRANEPFEGKFTLKPGEYEVWNYRQGPFDRDVVQENLREIDLKTDQGCTAILDRKEIERLARRNGIWGIDIDDSVMKCR